MDRRSRVLTAALALGLVATACGQSTYEYPRDAAEGVYFKVPREWTVFDETEDELDGRLPGSTNAIPVRVWVIDAHDDADPANAEAFDGDTPVGGATIYALGIGISEALSISELRSVGFDFDPANPQSGLEDTWEVVVDQQLLTDDGVPGAAVIFNHRDSVDDPWLTQGRVVYFDAVGGRAYLLDVYCSAECFDRNYDDIFAVLDSWRIDK